MSFLKIKKYNAKNNAGFGMGEFGYWGIGERHWGIAGYKRGVG